MNEIIIDGIAYHANTVGDALGMYWEDLISKGKANRYYEDMVLGLSISYDVKVGGLIDNKRIILASYFDKELLRDRMVTVIFNKNVKELPSEYYPS